MFVNLDVGAPALAKRALTAEQIAGQAEIALGYVQRAQAYRESLVRLS